MVQYSEHFCLFIFFHSPAKLIRCFSTLQDNQFCTLTYIQVGFVLHVVVFNCHFLSFQENLRKGQIHTLRIMTHIWSLASIDDWSTRPICYEPPSWSLRPSCHWTPVGQWPRRCSSLGSVGNNRKKKKTIVVVLSLSKFLNLEETPCSGSNHFGQVPHFVFAVLDLPPAVMDLLQKRQPKKTIQNGHLEDSTVQTLPTLTKFFSSYLI